MTREKKKGKDERFCQEIIIEKILLFDKRIPRLISIRRRKESNTQRKEEKTKRISNSEV